FDPSEIHLCFVGRLEAEKGIGLMIDALRSLPLELQQQVHTVHVVGTGKAVAQYQQKAQESGLHFQFYGLLARDAVHAIYKLCHAIILPSASEGFPKVIAEAMNYGCVPIVSNVSSIGHYIQHGRNGLLLETLSKTGLQDQLKVFITLPTAAYKQ